MKGAAGVVFLVASTAAVVSGSVLLPRAGCNADNCLRGVRATQYGDRGLEGCLSYWRTTYTPPPSTEYTTIVVSTTATSTDSITITTTVAETLTTLAPTTFTETIPTTFTQTKSLKNNNQFEKRNPVVQEGNTIPTYASFCSGTVRYSSACSCLGVSTISTVTAPTPITISTITETSITTIPTSIAVETESTTTTDATITLPSISTTTVATGPTETVLAFALQIVSPPSYAGRYLKTYEYTGPTAIDLRPTTDQNEASTIYLHQNDQGKITIRTSYSPGILWGVSLPPPSKNSITFRVSSDIPEYDFAPLLCTIGDAPGRAFSCSNSFGWNTYALWTATGSLGFLENSAAATSGWTVITLRAIPLP
ncbi:hypothetical protein TWF718_009439 [Orbilia javanica]|uniref:Uncharacterized protein n=1 Tax=Orbilia javanica TaxID=47235 RepID=A0AAN8RLD6_9PEZI